MTAKCTECKTQNAEWNCTECGADLCLDCVNFIEDDNIVCKSCYQEYLDDTYGICTFCGSEKEPIYDNVGFSSGEASKWEIVGFKGCLYCKYSHDNIEEDNYDYIF